MMTSKNGADRQIDRPRMKSRLRARFRRRGVRKDECHVSKLQLLPSESRRAGRGPANAPSYDSQQDTHHPHAIAAARRPIPPYAKAMTSKYD